MASGYRSFGATPVRPGDKCTTGGGDKMGSATVRRFHLCNCISDLQVCLSQRMTKTGAETMCIDWDLVSYGGGSVRLGESFVSVFERDQGWYTSSCGDFKGSVKRLDPGSTMYLSLYLY